MEGKNLPLKFAFLAMAVVLCLWSLFFGNGLREGIDLRGGHSVIFEIQTNEARLEQLREDKQILLAKLQKATSEELKKELSVSIERIDQEIKDLDIGDLSNWDVREIIRRLKRRVDPDGLRNLEWRPLGKNRFEVRMPAGMKGSQQARNKYLKALKRLEAKNLRRSQIARIESIGAGPERKALIAKLVGNDVRLSGLLNALGEKYEVMIAAKASGNEDAYLNALNEWEGKREEVKKRNISRQKIEGILNNYLSPNETKAIKKEREINRRKKRFADQVEALLAEYPARKAEIENVIEYYKAYAQVQHFLDDPGDLERLVAKAGVLEYRIAPMLPSGTADNDFRITMLQWQRYVKNLKEEGPEGARKRNEPFQWFPIFGESTYDGMVVEQYGGKSYILLCDQPPNTMLQRRGQGGWRLTGAKPTSDQLGTPAVGFNFDERGGGKFETLTRAHRGHQLAVLLDDEVYSVANIASVIRKEGIITGRFTQQEVRDLVSILGAGSLPAKPEPVARSSFGAGMGKDNRELGIQAAKWGLITVAAFMLGYYLLSGFIADVALLLNVILVLGAMSLLSAVFTLPGIAGVILTIGIAVDANVLIFERLREEQARKQSIRMALKNAYDRAFSAIFDANITTLITCLILGWVGTQEVRGFAITLGLGVTFSLFTALVVTRWVFQLLLGMGLLKSPTFMLHIIGVPKIDWMAKRRWFWCISIVLMAIGIGSLVWQGADIWGIEFSSGTKAVVQLRHDALIDDQLPSDGLFRQRVETTAGELGFDKLRATAKVETVITPDYIEKFLSLYDSDGDENVSRTEWQAKRLNERFFALMDADNDGQLSRQELDRLPASSYQISTTESRLGKVEQVVEKAFGDLLQRRISCTFDLVKDQRVEELNDTVGEDGLIRIKPVEGSRFYDLQQDYEGGVAMVIRRVTPALSIEELVTRIQEMRLQPDFADLPYHEAEVIGIKQAEEEKHSSFIVMFHPGEDGITDRPEVMGQFTELISEALKRSEAMLVTTFDPQIAGNAAQRAVAAVVLSWLAIVAYLWFRFGSVQWGLAAVLCLIHDVVIVVGLVGISGWLYTTWLGQVLGINSFKIDLAMIAAIMTVIGYSVNDTIVVFDRIRENRGKLTTVSSHVINASVNQTLGRTILTSSTTFIVVLIMYLWGGAGIHAFSYALLAGIIFGTYSSIAIASPLLMGFKKAMVAKATTVAE